MFLSGDCAQAVEAAASAADIEGWHAGMEPQEKFARLEALKAQGRRVLMVGDGLKDAPALAAAHASICLRRRPRTSQTASDAVFQARASPRYRASGHGAQTKAKSAAREFAIAFGYHPSVRPLAIAGYVTPLVAAIAMSTSSILVTVNAIRLRTAKLELRA